MGSPIITSSVRHKTIPAHDNNVVLAPHVVILGAGASIAAYLDWGKEGQPPPSMINLVEVLGLRDDVVAAGYDPKYDFESLYDKLASSGEHPDLKSKIEARVYEYFSSLTLPDKPTLYDHLVLSLREKDIIGTFNWDPFLMQAYMRNEAVTKTRRPKLAFLHGNVKVGICEQDRISGINGHSCTQCAKPLIPSKLLYPVSKKDYAADLFIKNEWDTLRTSLDEAYFLTVFGYSAPKTDVEARKLMLDAWKSGDSVDLAEVEIVDIKPRYEVETNWEEFFVREHYSILSGVVSSQLFRHPRRTCDAFYAATLMNDPWDDNQFPLFQSLTDLQKWITPLVDEEELYHRNGTAFSGTPLAPNKPTS
jgi:hypothetical protein